MPFDRRTMLAGGAAALLSPCAKAEPNRHWSARLISAARDQIGVTRHYDSGYVALSYPGGDVPPDRGVCSDVVIRAYRQAFGFDFQTAVHNDMSSAFDEYPSAWGLTRPDRSIDHRRVLNLETFLRRKGAQRPLPRFETGWLPGDLATMRVDGLPHIALVSNRMARAERCSVIHNIGLGTREEDVLTRFDLVGRFRFAPASPI